MGHHLVALIGNYGPYWQRLLPAAARHRDGYAVFFDHRHDPAERARFITERIPAADVDRFDAVIVDEPLGDCADGYHIWVPADWHDDLLTAVVCLDCNTVVAIEPVRFPRLDRRVMSAAS